MLAYQHDGLASIWNWWSVEGGLGSFTKERSGLCGDGTALLDMLDRGVLAWFY